MAISSQRLTIYLYSAHRAVIFAIAQLSCICIWLRLTTSMLNEYVMLCYVMLCYSSTITKTLHQHRIVFVIP